MRRPTDGKRLPMAVQRKSQVEIRAAAAGSCVSRSAILVLAAATAAFAVPVWGQTWRFTPSIALIETATNNVNLDTSDNKISDLVTSITPGLALSERGDRTRLDGFISVPIQLYARTGAENNEVFPIGGLLGDVSFFNRVLHVEAAVDISEQFFNPFGARPPDLTNPTDNRYRTVTYRVSPYVQGTVGNGVAYELRNNNVWANLNGAPVNTSNSRYTEWFGRVVTPENRPFGLEANYDYTDVTFSGQDLGALQTQIGRLIPFYNVSTELRIGASGGYEENQGTLTSYRGVVYGAGLEWRPTERTKVVGKWEHRYFGSSYLFTFAHRTGLTVWDVQVSRNVTTYPQQLGAPLQAGTNVPAYLNQLFLSSIPDEIARQQAVNQFMTDRGLPQTVAGPVTLYGEQILLQQQQTATVGLIGARNSVFFSVFNVRSEAISAAGTALPPSVFNANDNTQTGVSIIWNNRLTQAANLSATVNAYRTVANAPATGYTNQGSAEVKLSTPISPRMIGMIGVRYQTLTSDLSLDYNETSAYVGVSYAFR